MTGFQRSALLGCVALGAMLASSPVQAQSNAADDTKNGGSVLSQDIVVTAQKREESVQNVGIAVQAFTGVQLRALGIDKSSDIATFTPAVHTSGSLAGQNTQYTIRGVSQNDFNDVVEAPNAAYLDEGYIAIAQGQSFAVVDIDRVEVLKGPQGTLFGRNATGGLVHYISHLPSMDKWEGFFDSKLGVMDSLKTPMTYTMEGAAGGPIANGLAIRGAVRWNKADPWLINSYPAGAVGGSPGPGAGANLGDDDTLSARLTLRAQPSDRSEFILSGNYSRSKLSTGPYQAKPTIAVYNAAGELINVLDTPAGETRASIGVAGAPGVIGTDAGSDLNNDGIVGGPGELYGRPAGTDFFGYKDPDGAGPRISSDFAFRKSAYVDTWGLGLRAKIELSDSITLNSVTDYKQYNKLLFIDVDAGPANQLANYEGVDAHSFSQELRLSGQSGRLHWVLGGFYLNVDNRPIAGLKAPINGLVPGNPIDIATTAHLKTRSISGFGQVDYDLTDKFRVVLGGRIISEHKDYQMIQQIIGTTSSLEAQTGPVFVSIGPVPAADPTYRDKFTKSLWAGKLQFEYRPNSDTLLYAGVNRGVKAGSYNAPLAGGLAAPLSALKYGDETLWSYEGGFKLTLADNKLRLNGAVYYYDYKNYQSFLFTGVAGLVVNADARTYGGELSLQANPIPGLDIAAGISLFNAKVKNVPLRVAGPIIRDVKPTYAPETQISGLIRYGFDAFGGELAVRSDFSYSSSYYYNLRNFDADKFPSYLLINAGLTWTSPNKTWELGVGVDNLTNKHIGVQGFDLATLCGCNEVSYKAPRTYTTRIRFNF